MSSDSSTAFRGLALREITFAYQGASQPLFADLSMHLPVGFTGIVGANGAGKTTLLRLLAGALEPASGTLQGVTDAAYCEQRTDSPPAQLADFLDDWDADAFELRGRLGIGADFGARWNTLSHGERKRVQIGCALWRRPTLLAIDEPTNHIDAHARDLLLGALQRFRGVGVIVSHDRELLDALCVQCLWLDPPAASVYAGNFSQAREQRSRERATAIAERNTALRAYRQLERELARRRDRAERAQANRTKRGLKRHDSDAREKIDRARVSDGKAGAALRQLDGRAGRAKARVDAAHVAKQYQTGIWLPGARSRRDALLELAAGEIAFGGGRGLRHPRLVMKPDDRIAITGVNGAGKSTLVTTILAAANVPAGRLIAMPQELTASASGRVLDEARALPAERLGRVFNVVSRLGSRPQRLLESRQPSPGEIRKLLLALGMARAPHLIVMDEPTNHLDLPSIEALEHALADCPCGLILVSHDRYFLDRLTRINWHIEVNGEGNSELSVR